MAQRVAAGQVNVNTDVRTKSIPQIVASNLLTLFNVVNALLAVLVISTGQYRNLMFLLVVFANLAIGIFQEIRSKLTIDKLSIVAARDSCVIRDGEDVNVPVDEIVLDDLVRLAHGDQVPADAVIVSGDVQMDESLLTGESRTVRKGPGDHIMSGSFVATGALVARVETVGAEGYAARINAEAKYVKAVRSEILDTLRMIIRISSVALVPLGAGLYLRSVASGVSQQESILTSVAAMVGMIPQGLVLLTSTVLAIATTRLARQSVLVQQLYCVETLARVDVLCLDKTGTITTGSMEVEGIAPAAGHDDDEVAQAIATIAASQADDSNDTGKALLAYAADNGIAAGACARSVPFSSERKLSGCVTEDGRSLVLGAAQFVLHERSSAAEPLMAQFGSRSRKLVVCACDGFDDEGVPLGEPELMGVVALRDEIRSTAAQTVSFFREQGVILNVISGDDPATVSAIASEVGIPGAKSYVDASQLADDEALMDAARSCHVFGRVTPQQKRTLVTHLKAAGHTVAMTGDGVNDVLALKEADCSVAMASGSDAARNVAEIVLVDNDFAHMPAVVAEGRRSINNLQRSASLFLVKTVYAAIVAAICIVLPPYPFLPVQMSMLSGAIIGIPSFVLALEPNRERVRGRFLENVLRRSIPASIAISACILAAIVLREQGILDEAQTSTIAMLATACVGFALIERISQPLTPLRAGLLAFVAIFVVACSTLLAPFFQVSALAPAQWGMLAIIVAAGVILFEILFAVSVGGAERRELMAKAGNVALREGRED